MRIGDVVQLTGCKGGPRPIDDPPRRPPVLKATPAPQTKTTTTTPTTTPATTTTTTTTTTRRHVVAISEQAYAWHPSPSPESQPLTIRTMGQFTPQKCRGCGYVERNRRDGGVKPCLTCGRLWCNVCGSHSIVPPGWQRRAWRLVMRLSVNRHRCWGCVVLPNRYGPVLPAPPPPPQWPYPQPDQ